MTRKQLIRRLDARLGSRKLVWFGTRGEDCRALLDLPQFSEVFSLIAPFGSVAMKVDECLESLTGVRVDLDTYDLDKDTSEPARELRRRLFHSLSEPAVLVPYRPLAFLSSVQYPRAEYVESLGLFHERQAPFEHKPWVESELRRIGVPIVPWRYYTDDDRQRVAEQIESAGPVVLRTNRSDGGVGLSIVEDPARLQAVWRPQEDGFLAVAPLLLPHVPLNVSACVFADGSVTLHPPSLQLLGIHGCTNRPFGYCGNDFAAAKELEPAVLEALDEMTRTVGRWLAQKGYLGAFGIDAMVHGSHVLLAEVNPRFQGSSALSARIDADLGRPDVFLSHLGAFLGFSAEDDATLTSLAAEQPRRAQVICHNSCGSPRRLRDGGGNPPHALSLVPTRGIRVLPEAVLFRTFIEGSVTDDGFTLAGSVAGDVIELAQSGFEAADTTGRRVVEHAASTQSAPDGSADGQEQPIADPGSDRRRSLHTLPGRWGVQSQALESQA